MTADHLNSLPALFDTPILVCLAQIVWHPPGRSLLLVQILLQDVVSCGFGDVTKSSKMPHCRSLVRREQFLHFSNFLRSPLQRCTRPRFVPDLLFSGVESTPPAVDCWLGKSLCTINRLLFGFGLHLGQSGMHTKADVTSLLQFELLHVCQSMICSEGRQTATLDPIWDINKACQLDAHRHDCSQGSHKETQEFSEKTHHPDWNSTGLFTFKWTSLVLLSVSSKAQTLANGLYVW